MTAISTTAPPRIARTPQAMDHEAEGAARDLYWQGYVDRCSEPSALIDATGQVLRTTAAFDALLTDSVARWSTLPHEQARVEAALRRATTGIAPTAAAVRFSRGAGQGLLVLVIRPIPWATRLIHAPAGAAIATLIDATRHLAPAPDLWREAFGLTPSETTLAALLMAGHSLESAAAARDCSQATLRVHLRHIFAKTGVSRQSDLVTLLARVGRT